MRRSRSTFRALVAGCLLSVGVFAGPATMAGAAPYPPAVGAYSAGSIWIDGNTVNACGNTGATDALARYSLGVDGAVLTTGTTNADGSYCVQAPLPDGLAAGEHVAKFTGIKNGAAFDLTVTFSVAGGAVTSTGVPGVGLPRTGGDSTGMVQLGAALVVAGVGLVGVSTVRRRRPVDA